MKKYLLLLLAVCQGGAVMAQQPTSYKMKVTLKSGEKIVMLTEDIDSLTFADYDKVKVNLSERFVTSSTVAVNIELQENSKRFYALCLPASQQIPENQLKDYILAHKTVEKETSYKKSFDMLQPETEYTVYALAFDINDVPSEVSKITLKTGKVEDDELTIKVNSVTRRTVDFSVKPKNPNTKFYTLCSGLDKYYKDCDERENHGDVVKHYIAMWTYFASMYGGTWQSLMNNDLKSGVFQDVQGRLRWNDDQMIVAFGMNEDGTLSTPVYTKNFKTQAPTPSTNQIKLEIKSVAYRKVILKATTTNNDSYYLGVQPASYVDRFSSREEMINHLCYESTVENQNFNGDTETEFNPFKPDQDYYAIAVGLDDNAPSTAPIVIKFHHPAKN